MSRGNYEVRTDKTHYERRNCDTLDKLASLGLYPIKNENLKEQLCGLSEPPIIPLPAGEVIGYKKVRIGSKSNRGLRRSWRDKYAILKLRIPETSEIDCVETVFVCKNTNTNEEIKKLRHRTNLCYVESAIDENGDEVVLGEDEVLYSHFDYDYIYHVGEVAIPRDAMTPYNSQGIYFFLDEETAIRY